MMATYYSGGGGAASEIQPQAGGDATTAANNSSNNLQTLYLMNPTFSGYHHASNNNSSSQDHHQQQQQLPTNMLLLNSPPPSSSSFQSHLAFTQHPHNNNNNNNNHHPHQHQHQHLVGIPLASPSHHQEDPTHAGFLPQRLHYNLWTTTPADPSPSSSSSHSHIPTAIAMTPAAHHELASGFRRPPPPAIQHQHQHQQQQQQQGGLSLSLNNTTHQQQQQQNTATTMPLVTHHHHMPAPSGSPANVVVGGGDGVGGLALGSKYLKAAQELLDEVVNVEIEATAAKNSDHPHKAKLPLVESSSAGGGGGESSKRSGGGVSSSSTSHQQQELTTAQRQELQMKKAKLLNMLDEVEQRYRQYHTQMQIVVSSFEQAAGAGAARAYTSLALQTISKQFRSLKDAIASQVRATSKALGEVDDDAAAAAAGAAGSTTRLKFVDHQLRQQRALQQLGMVQHNAWRPQRGLPERAVSVLRAWLFEHFLHPYPKDSDKHMLAKQTGLTRSQVSNWFINARVRLWKPMVEEMYLEEIKSQEQNNGNQPDANNVNDDINNHSRSSNPHPQVEKTTHILNHNNNNINNNNPLSTTPDHQHHSNNPATLVSPTPASLLHHHHHHHHHQSFSLINPSSSDMDSILFRRSSPPKRQRSTDNNIHNNSPSSIISMEMEMKPDHQSHRDLFIMTPGGAAFGSFPPPMSEIGSRFDPSPTEQHLAAAHHHHRFMHGNGGVSLTLGLPHGENLNLSPNNHHHLQQHNFISTTHNMQQQQQQQQQLGRRSVEHHHMDQVGEGDFCGTQQQQQQPPPAGGGAYDGGIDLQSRKRFAAQLLQPDFVT